MAKLGLRLGLGVVRFMITVRFQVRFSIRVI
jgi:hypothetical protein